MRGRSMGGNLLAALLLFLSLAGLVGAFTAPARLAVRSGRECGMAAPGAMGKESPSSERKMESAPVDIAEKTRIMRDQMRDAIWKATDTIVHAVDDMPDIGKSNTTQALTRLGSMIEDIDEKYFSKYLTVGAKPTYRQTLAASTTTLEREAGAATSTERAAADLTKTKADAKAKAKDKSAKSTTSGTTSTSSKTADVASKGSSTTAGAAAATAGKAAANTVTAAAATAAAAKSASPKDKVGSASGTVQLDRPEKVQGVFDEIQKKAVEYYKTTPATASSKGSGSAAGRGAATAGGVATPMPEAVQLMEARLESLLTESRFRPRKLKKDKKSSLVDAITAMETAYPADANPLGDPALSGQWSVVYSSSSRLIGRALKGVLAGFFKTSDARQVVDTGASSVINACRARLRMTPLSMRVATQGSYRATGDRKVSVDMSPPKRGLWRRLLPRLRSGKVEAEVTYLSNKWRICRAGGVTVAFRKTEV